ncbi:MAG: hypothetical protein VYD57_12840 [Pseudomonadota bacterium]|nr:hypothetical protein [Pseudomonadota bacterium]
MRRITAGFSAAAFATMLSCGTALAADANAFAERVKEAMASQGATLTYDDAVSEGDTVIMRGVQIGEGSNKVDFGQVNFEDVTGAPDTGYEVARVGFEDISGTDKASGDRTIAYDIMGMSIESLMINGTQPSSNQPALLQGTPFYFERASVDTVKLSEDGEETFSVGDVTVTSTIGDQNRFDSDFNVGNFRVILPEEKGDDGANMGRELGYDVLTGSMQSEVNWTSDQGKLALSPTVLNIDNVGTLRTDLVVDGYTPEVIQSLQKISEDMRQNPENQQNSGMAIMGILAQLSLSNVSLSFEDDSLTQRLIDYYAKEMNQSPQAVIDMATQIVQANISQIGDKAFQDQVVSAVQTFLRDPQSIRVATEPAQPIPFMQIMGSVMGAPQTLPQVLSLSVSANGDSDQGSSNATAQ